VSPKVCHLVLAEQVMVDHTRHVFVNTDAQRLLCLRVGRDSLPHAFKLQTQTHALLDLALAIANLNPK